MTDMVDPELSRRAALIVNMLDYETRDKFRAAVEAVDAPGKELAEPYRSWIDDRTTIPESVRWQQPPPQRRS